MKKNLLIFFLVILVTGYCLLVTITDAWAGIYSYTDEKGQIYATYQEEGLAIETKEDGFDLFIKKLAEKHNLDPLLVKAVIKVESDFEVEALSRKGAQGLMQLMPQTARDLEVKDVWDPHHNIEGGVKYLRKMFDKFNNNLSLALAAYNAGPNKVKQYGKIPPYPETQKFVRKVISYYQYYKTQSDALYVYTDENGSRCYTNIFSNIPKGVSWKRID
ncbi:lytic transglycosylase domain-containing protein [bacterium]|nr:lytic transglycosylase domain-containing protein [bacterium]MBU4310856.1 lytic transglycosylase domain-containing protein [bacterium]MCG2676021.1 lytic transglycosylase domain-containing protein [bacterium]MCG2677284.1 lytic transglycosylase domain-containing protein [bacterium]